MRRFLFGAGCYLAGIMTLPLLSVGVHTLSARSVSHEMRTPPYRGIVAQHNSAAQCQVMLPAAGNCRHAPVATLELTDALAQANANDDDKPFGPPSRTRLREFERPSPPIGGPPMGPFVRVMPCAMAIGLEMLASDAPPDEAEVTKTKELREALQKVVEEKAEALNAKGLEFEIKFHQSHLAELQSLKALLALERSLKELKGKFPDSDAGRRAQELLDLLQQQHHRGVRPTPIPDYGPRPSSPPSDDDGLRPRSKPVPARDVFDSDEVPPK